MGATRLSGHRPRGSATRSVASLCRRDQRLHHLLDLAQVLAHAVDLISDVIVHGGQLETKLVYLLLHATNLLFNLLVKHVNFGGELVLDDMILLPDEVLQCLNKTLPVLEH